MAAITCGVDIGSDALKCAVGDGHAVRAFWCSQPQPERRSMRDRLAPSEWESRVIGLLRNASKALPGWTNRVILGIQGFGTRIGYGELPPLRGEQLDTAVSAAISREIGSLQSLVVSHMTVPSLTPNKMGILWAACPSARARSLVRVAQGAGLQVERFEIPTLAAVRSLTRNHDIPPDTWNVMVEVGFEFTTVALFKNGVPYFTRDFWIAGGHLTAAIVSGKGCSWKEAEQMKRTHDLRTRDPVFETPLLRWLTELRRTQLYAISQHHFEAPSKVYLTGGTSRCIGLAERVEEAFGAPVVVDAWKSLRVPPDHEAGTYSTAAGLVLEPAGKG